MKTGFPIFLILILLIMVSCPSSPKPQEVPPPPEPQPQTQPQPQSQLPPQLEVFSPEQVTQAQYTSAMEEVQVFINELNEIIRRGNYQAWRARLSLDYFAMISSPEFLADVSEQPAMKSQRIVLRTTEDYFRRVVVPSRANSRVDSIEFTDRDKVIAYTVMTNRAGEEVRLRLYDLEKINNSWIIIN